MRNKLEQLGKCRRRLADRDAAAAVQAKPVAFAPVIGAPAKVSSKMNESLAAAAGQKNIRVASSQDAEYTIRGYLVAAADAKGTKLSYIWDITDKSGKRAKRLQGDELIEGKKGGDPWALVDDAAIQRISAKTADEISSWMSTGGTATAANAPAAAQAQNAPPAAAQPQKQASASEPSANVLSVQTPQTDTPTADNRNGRAPPGRLPLWFSR